MSRFVPRGVTVAGLGKRLAAFLLDSLPVAVVLALVWWVLSITSAASVVVVAGIIGAVVLGAYGLYQWWSYAARGAGLGARSMGLRLVGMRDGEPIGWWRYFLRALVFWALMVSVVGGIAMLVFLIIHERRQGWHDLAVGSLVVQPQQAQRPKAPKKQSTTRTVDLPPHLASSFSPQTNQQVSQESWQAYAPEASSSRPAWMPELESAPVNPGLPQQPPIQSPPAQPAPPPAQPAEAPVHPVPQPSPAPNASRSVPAANQPRVRAREFVAEAEDDDGTHIATPAAQSGTRPGDEGWFIRLDDGREIDLTEPVLLGRSPRAATSDGQVQLVAAGGDGRMISRTHVLVGVDPRGVYVIDRGSTNGTALVGAGGALEPCPADVQMRVSQSQQVSYGNRWFTVLRRPA